MIRLFVAVEIPESIAEEVSYVYRGLPGANWTRPENLHITLKFLGDTDEKKVCKIQEVLSSIKHESFRIKLSGVGNFSKKGSGPIIWIHINPLERLRELHRKVENKLNSLEIPGEKRKYTPHLTIARMKRYHHGRMEDYMNSFSQFESSEFEVNAFHLFSSQLKPEGAIHTIENSFPLA